MDLKTRREWIKVFADIAEQCGADPDELEAVDHHMLSGRPRYDGFTRCGCKFYQTSRPVTRAEFRTIQTSVPLV